MNAHVVVPSSILGRTDRVSCYRALCSWGLGGFPPAGARADQAGGASQVSAQSEHAPGRSGAPRHAELRYRSVVPRYRYSGVRQFPIMQSRAQGTTRPRSAFVGADGLHAPSLRGGLTGCARFPRMRGEFRCCSRASRPRDARAYARLRPWLLQTAVLLVLMGYSRGLSRGKRCTGLLKHRK